MTDEQRRRFHAALSAAEHRYMAALPPVNRSYWEASLEKLHHPFEVRTIAAEMTVISDAWERVAQDFEAGRNPREIAHTYPMIQHIDAHRRMVWVRSVKACKNGLEAENLASQYMVFATLYLRWADVMDLSPADQHALGQS